MATKPIDTTLLSQYMRGGKRGATYQEKVNMYDEMRVHVNGENPTKLIGERRPHESEYAHKYRLKIYQPITKSTVGSVIKSLGKIRRSTEWSIKYDASAIPPSIMEGETLEDYCEKNFPYYGSLTNWVFTVLLKSYITDANGLILIMPTNRILADNEYLKPFPVFFNCPQILEIREGEWCLLKAHEGEMWYVVTRNEIYTFEERGEKKDIVQTDIYEHKLGYLPIVRVRSTLHKTIGGEPIYESVISSMLPFLNEAVREYSDQQINTVNHLFPERWQYATMQCKTCSTPQGVSIGYVDVTTGRGATKKIVKQTCPDCGGSGSVINTSPFNVSVVRPTKDNMGETPAPIPPFGYVQKGTEIFKVIDDRISRHKYESLCSINMQFLMQTPLNQSGYAKEVDRDELNNFVYGVAEDLVWMMDNVYRIICDYRYSFILPETKTRNDMLPSVAVPEKFDILSTTYLAYEVENARTAKLNGVIIAALEVDYCAKKFYNAPDVRDELKCVMELDPMIGITEEEKMVRYQNGGVTKEDYILSCNLVRFVKEAIHKEKGFLNMPYEKRKEIVEKYASELAKEETGIATPPAE